ncbi:MAG: polysaccharide biosynthesis protein [Oscillospiraceae bacterium]|jgi:FlaA1/EpsC-like NDP-sugar epimerase|nr:polysaccharide biosynthesis protein [Oscillospiraceae bacterium]
MQNKHKCTAGIAVQRVFLPLLDALFVNGSYFLAVFLLNNLQSVPRQVLLGLLGRTWYVAVFSIAMFYLFHLYHSLWQYASADELGQCATAAAVSGVACYFTDWVFETQGWLNVRVLHPGELLIAYLLSVAFCGGMRVGYRFLRRSRRHLTQLYATRIKSVVPRLMIVGAGSMANIILGELRANDFRLGVPVVIVDDDPAKHGKYIHAVPVRGTCEDIPRLAAKYAIDEILICIPSATPFRQKQIIQLAIEASCRIKSAPSVLEMKESGGQISVGQLRDIRIEDLLMRPEIHLDTRICSYLLDQTVLVTGAGGSIGSELCRQILRYQPKKIILFDINENAVFNLKHSLDRAYHGTPELVIRIGSVCDGETLDKLFAAFRPQVVFHAAAHKHVPLMEDCPVEAVKNNIFGTLQTAQTAANYGVSRFVMLSTDKAVNPTNVMGATKRVTELIMQTMPKRGKTTTFTAVRFGNVLGSNGSVIPLFQEQITAGGPVTVTDPDITRYFMSIPEAAQLVVQAGGLSKNGDIFVLDMGEPVRIITLAEQMIRLSGLQPYKDIAIEIIGLRPGEKMFEELAYEEELATRQTTENKKIFITYPKAIDLRDLDAALERLRTADESNVRQELRRLVTNYTLR